MARTESNTTNEPTPPEPKPAAAPPAPTARDVVTATSTIVNAIESLPPTLQVRALIAAGTALGLQLTTRGAEQPRQQQQRPQTSNGQQQPRSGNR